MTSVQYTCSTYITVQNHPIPGVLWIPKAQITAPPCASLSHAVLTTRHNNPPVKDVGYGKPHVFSSHPEYATLTPSSARQTFNTTLICLTPPKRCTIDLRYGLHPDTHQARYWKSWILDGKGGRGDESKPPPQHGCQGTAVPLSSLIFPGKITKL